jgi:hypothetical protein
MSFMRVADKYVVAHQTFLVRGPFCLNGRMMLLPALECASSDNPVFRKV